MKKIVIAVILTAIVCISGTVFAVTQIDSKEVTYDNTESGLESTNVQGALNELYGIASAITSSNSNSNSNSSLVVMKVGSIRYAATGADYYDYAYFLSGETKDYKEKHYTEAFSYDNEYLTATSEAGTNTMEVTLKKECYELVLESYNNYSLTKKNVGDTYTLGSFGNKILIFL